MPGLAEPALGSDVLTRVVAALASVAVVALPFALDRVRPGRLAVGGGLAYAGFCVACWLGGRRLLGQAD